MCKGFFYCVFICLDSKTIQIVVCSFKGPVLSLLYILLLCLAWNKLFTHRNCLFILSPNHNYFGRSCTYNF